MEDRYMSLTVKQGQAEVVRILREVAEERGVKIDHEVWEEPAGEIEPSYYNLEVHTVSKRMVEKKFSSKNLTELVSDNEMKVQVRMKIESIIITLKKYER